MKIHLFTRKADQLKIIKWCSENSLSNIISTTSFMGIGLIDFLSIYGFLIHSWTKWFRIHLHLENIILALNPDCILLANSLMRFQRKEVLN